MKDEYIFTHKFSVVSLSQISKTSNYSMSSVGREERKAEFLQHIQEDLKSCGKKTRKKKKLGVNFYQSCNYSTVVLC